MFLLQSTIASALDRMFAPFKRLDPIWALLAVSLLTTVLVLELWRRTTRPTQIREVKNRLQAHLLEVRLFKDAPDVVVRALAGMMRSHLSYLRCILKLTLLLLPLLAALMIHLDAWFGHSPLRPGQSTVVAVRISPAAASTLDDWSLDVPPSLTVGTPPLRLASVGEVSWAVRAGQVGKHRLQIRGQGVVVQKTVVVSNRGWDRLAPRSVKGTSWNHLLYPGDADLPEDSPVEWIEVRYPALGVRLLGWEMSWWLLFFLSSCGFGLVASRLMRVTI